MIGKEYITSHCLIRVKNYLIVIRVKKIERNSMDVLVELSKVHSLISVISKQVFPSRSGEADSTGVLWKADFSRYWTNGSLFRVFLNNFSSQQIYGELGASLQLRKKHKREFVQTRCNIPVVILSLKT